MQLRQLVTNVTVDVSKVVRGVKPGTLDGPTPCADWDVRALANHLLQVVSALHLAGRGDAVPDDLWGRDLMSGDDWAERFEDEARRAADAWADPAAAERAVRVGASEMPAGFAASMLVSDLVIHGWDLASATGQDYACDDAAAEVAHRFLADTGEQGRAMGIFAQPVTVAEAAPALHRALGLSGRDPQWAAV